MIRQRILLAIAGLPCGGAERQLSLLATGLDRSRWEVGLLIFGRSARIHYGDVFDQPLRFRALELTADLPRPVMLARLFSGIAGAVGDFHPNLIHTSLNVANHAVRATGLLAFPHVPVITSVRSEFRRYTRAEHWAERLLCRRSTIITANAEFVRRQLIEGLDLKPERVVTVPNGIEPRFFSGQGGVLPPGWPERGPVALLVGRFHPVKNHQGLIEAIKVLDAAGQLGDWRFVFVGDGPIEDAVRAAAVPLGDRVVILPPVADPAPLYRAAAVTLLVSHSESLPNTVLEAQASGCPVAMTVGANSSGALDPANGWLLEGDLACALKPMLDVSPQEFERKGMLAQRDMNARYSVAAMVTATEGLYDRVCRPALSQASV